jgi:tetratricopeptide (TPR) repeat protein
MLEALSGKEPPDSIVDSVFDETEGNPFFVEEVFRHLVEEGKVFDDAGEFRRDINVDELDVPESVRLVVGRRLERLGADAQRVLAAGAVVGRGFPFALLEAITQVDADHLLDIVEQAETARVIVPEMRDGDVHYTFAHELIRQTLLAGLSVLRRQRLHLSIADAIERIDTTAPDTRPSEIAHHLLEAGAGADTERTLDYLERTADRAMEAAAFEEALRAIDDALALVGDTDSTRRARLLERKGWTVRGLGRFEDCIDLWNDVVPVYDQIGEHEVAARLCWEMGYQFIWLSQFPEAFASYARGIEILGDRRSATLATLIGATGALLGLAGSFDQSDEQFVEARAIAEELGDERALARIWWGRTIACWANARLQPAIESGRTAIEYAQRAQDQWVLVDALAWTSFAVSYGGAPVEAGEMAQRGIELGQKLGHVAGELLARRGVSLAAIQAGGDLETLERHARDDLARLQSIRSPWVSQSHAWVANILTLRGELESALREVETAIELEPASGFSGFGASVKFMNRALAGDLPAFQAMLDAREAMPTPGEAPTLGERAALFAAAQGCAILGLNEQAAALYPLLAESVDDVPIAGVFDVALSHRIAGMAAAAARRWDDAATHFETAVRQCDALPNLMDRPSVLHWYGHMLVERGAGDSNGARRMLTEALDSYRAYGMPVHAAMVETLLRNRLG